MSNHTITCIGYGIYTSYHSIICIVMDYIRVNIAHSVLVME